mmetsp:Transcript_53800/g.155265  ORF Transcript_53800/g.155265 Transcript_53800/m.155265 type:complete len:299 (-) Transcript_53800:1262-2158(-)
MDLRGPHLAGGRRRGEGHGRGGGRARLPRARRGAARGNQGEAQVLRRHVQMPQDVHRQRPPRLQLPGLQLACRQGLLRLGSDHHGWQEVQHQEGPLPAVLQRVRGGALGLPARRLRRQWLRLRRPEREDQRHVLPRHRGEGALRRQHEHRQRRQGPLPQELRQLPAGADLLRRQRRHVRGPGARTHPWRRRRHHVAARDGGGARGRGAGSAGKCSPGACEEGRDRAREAEGGGVHGQQGVEGQGRARLPSLPRVHREGRPHPRRRLCVRRRQGRAPLQGDVPDLRRDADNVCGRRGVA